MDGLLLLRWCQRQELHDRALAFAALGACLTSLADFFHGPRAVGDALLNSVASHDAADADVHAGALGLRSRAYPRQHVTVFENSWWGSTAAVDRHNEFSKKRKLAGGS
jgi:hypothetical protein